MSIVYKYKLPTLNTGGELEVLANPQVVLVGVDPQGQKSIWIRGDRQFPKAKVKIHVSGTGCDVLYPFHLGSFVSDELVYHVWSPDMKKAE